MQLSWDCQTLQMGPDWIHPTAEKVWPKNKLSSKARSPAEQEQLSLPVQTIIAEKNILTESQGLHFIPFQLPPKLTWGYLEGEEQLFTQQQWGFTSARRQQGWESCKWCSYLVFVSSTPSLPSSLKKEVFCSRNFAAVYCTFYTTGAKLPVTSKPDRISKINYSSWAFTKFSLSECSRTGGAWGEERPLNFCFSRFPLWSCCVTQPQGS